MSSERKSSSALEKGLRYQERTELVELVLENFGADSELVMLDEVSAANVSLAQVCTHNGEDTHDMLRFHVAVYAGLSCSRCRDGALVA